MINISINVKIAGKVETFTDIGVICQIIDTAIKALEEKGLTINNTNNAINYITPEHPMMGEVAEYNESR